MEKWTLIWTKLIQFDQEKIEALPGNMQGIYRLSYVADSGNYYVFYVGKAEDIKARLSQHLSDEKNICVKNYLSSKECFFRYAKVSVDYVRNAAERQMVNHYEPECNKIKPEGRDNVEVNLN